MIKKMLQSEFLNKAEGQLEDQLKEVISVFQNLPETILLKPGYNQGWSISACFAHLNSYAEFYLPRLDIALRNSPTWETPGIFKFSIPGKYFINSMDTSMSTKKFKALKKHVPAEITDPNSVISTFIQHLENFLAILKLSRNKNLRKISVKTSISPWIKINAGDVIEFLLTHNKRHLEQARRNL